ncbi:MAG: uracil phosphoribosyltransferase [Bacteroidia bacterium]
MDARITLLSKTPSYLNHLLQEMRDITVQGDRMRFRTNLEKAGELMAYEMSKSLDYEDKTITTPLGQHTCPLLKEQPIVVSILRAGLPLHQGALRMLDRADNGFISAYRHHTKGNKFIVKVEYLACPSIEGRDVILLDPMIATGQSLVLAYEALLQKGKPARILVGGVIASEAGVAYVLKHIPQAQVYACAIDHELTAKSYIVPGLGDAGDLAYGEK